MDRTEGERGREERDGGRRLACGLDGRVMRINGER